MTNSARNHAADLKKLFIKENSLFNNVAEQVKFKLNDFTFPLFFFSSSEGLSVSLESGSRSERLLWLVIKWEFPFDRTSGEESIFMGMKSRASESGCAPGMESRGSCRTYCRCSLWKKLFVRFFFLFLLLHLSVRLLPLSRLLLLPCVVCS